MMIIQAIEISCSFFTTKVRAKYKNQYIFELCDCNNNNSVTMNVIYRLKTRQKSSRN